MITVKNILTKNQGSSSKQVLSTYFDRKGHQEKHFEYGCVILIDFYPLKLQKIYMTLTQPLIISCRAVERSDNSRGEGWGASNVLGMNNLPSCLRLSLLICQILGGRSPPLPHDSPRFHTIPQYSTLTPHLFHTIPH